MGAHGIPLPTTESLELYRGRPFPTLDWAMRAFVYDRVQDAREYRDLLTAVARGWHRQLCLLTDSEFRSTYPEYEKAYRATTSDA